jgi:serine/threonine-protein kinase
MPELGPREGLQKLEAGKSISQVRAEFISSWETSLSAGEEPPRIDLFLTRVSEADRSEFRRELSEIHQAFSKRASPVGFWQKATVDQMADTPLPECRGTIDSIHSRQNDVPSYQTAAFERVSQDESQAQPPDSPGLPNTDFSLKEEGAPSAKPPSVVVPGYEIVGELGRGGMGVVYKARQLGLNRWVALKMVLAGAHASPDRLGRFLTEAKAVAGLQHPNIVQIHEIGEHDGLPFFSLEFVGGGSLEAKVHRKPQPPREAAHLVETLAQAIQYAHEHGVIHRDLKPANILLTVDGMPKVTDFGLAKRLEEDSSQTKSGTLMGTPNYMAPEQARGDVHQVGPLADVYTLGAILYELLTGRPPFRGATVLETVKQVTNDEPIPPSRLQPQVPRDVETICLKCLQKDMGKRYGSALLLAEDLRRFLSHEPILARPTSNWERLIRWCRRNPRLAALVGTVAFLLIVVAVGSLGATYRISREMTETERQKKIADQNAIAEKLAHEEADRNAEIAKTNAEVAKKAQDLAGQQAQVALDTVYNVVTTTDEKLRPIAESGPLRKELLQLAMKQLDQISKDVVNSGRADRIMGVALQRMGKFYEQMGQTQQEIVVIERSLEIFNRLMKDQPDDDLNKFDAAISHDYLAEIGRENWGDPSKIIAHQDQALEMRLALVANRQTAEPDPFLRRRDLAVTYIYRAGLFMELGDPEKALESSQAALDQSNAALALDTSKVQDRRALLSAAYYFMAKAGFRLGRPDDARRYFQDSRLLREEWVKALPLDAEGKQNLGRTLEALGDMEMEQRHYPAALAFYQKSQANFQQLLDKDPNVPEYQWFRANVDYDLGTVHRILGDETKAKEHFVSCLKVREAQLAADKNNLQRKVELFLVQARLGKHLEAAKAAQEMVELAPNHPGKLFSSACGFALCIPGIGLSDETRSGASQDQALERDYANKAITALRQAIRVGFKDRVALETCSELEPLGTLSGYKQLLRQIAKP